MIGPLSLSEEETCREVAGEGRCIQGDAKMEEGIRMLFGCV